jgi:hypothetical protein
MLKSLTGVRRYATSIAVVVALTAIIATPALAITDGQPDQDGHPYVGLMIAKGADGNPLWRCSGTLLSDTVFLTAGHCTEAPAASVVLWFDSGYPSEIPLGAGYPAAVPPNPNRCTGVVGYPCTGDATGMPFTHPDYNPNAFYLRDMGIVILDSPYPMAEYGTLPSLNQLDLYATKRGQNKAKFTAVGYGLQKSFPDAAGWKDSAFRTRMVASPIKLNQINGGIVGDFSLLLSNNANTGGTCFGDSGGPNFLGGTSSTLVVGVTSFGLNGNCAGTGGVFRVDRSWSLDFINDALSDGDVDDYYVWP